MRRMSIASLFSLLLVTLVTAPIASAQSPESATFAPEGVARLLLVSPDGAKVAGSPDLRGETLCIYAIPSAEEISCADLRARKIQLNITDLAWSPDSATLVFAERPLITLIDGDIWTMDAETGELTNVTDDGYEGVLPFIEEQSNTQPVNVDVIPRFSPDNTLIAFSRTIVSEPGGDDPSELWVLDLATGESRRVVRVSEEEPGLLYFNLAWSPDGATIYVSLFHADQSDPENGIWSFDVATGEGEQIASASSSAFEGAAPAIMAASPAGDLLTVYYPQLLGAFGVEGQSGYGLLSLGTGEITPIESPDELNIDAIDGAVLAPGFSPDGSSLLYTVKGFGQIEGALVVRDLETGDERIIELPDGLAPTVNNYADGTVLGAGGRAFLLTSLDVATLVPVSGASQPPATPIASPATSAEVQHYVAGERSRLLELSPDGAMVAGMSDDDYLCTFAVPSGDPIACADVIEPDISVDFESVSWAPDSTAFVFSVPAFAYFVDSDLWRFDAQSGELTNLTDDDFEGTLPLFGDELDSDQIVNVDVAPAWSPDGQSIAFSRSTISAENGDDVPNELWVLDVASGDAHRIFTVDETHPGILYYGLLWAPGGETLYATYRFFDIGNPGSGVYAIDLASSDARQLAGPNAGYGEDAPTVTGISPDGRTLIVCFSNYLETAGMSDDGGYALLSTEDGSITRVDPPVDIDPEHAVAITPAFSADGESLIYPVVRLSKPGGVLIRRELISGDETIIATLPDGEQPVATARNQSLIIGANGVALVPVNPFEAYLVQISEEAAPHQGHIEITLPTPEPVG